MDLLRKVRLFFGLENEPELSEFQRKKLLHEFNMFYDINKDGRLQWKDFELARDYVCSKSGWKPESTQWTHCRQLFVELWRNLQDVADENMDGELTTEEWLQMWTKIHRAKHKAGLKTGSSKTASGSKVQSMTNADGDNSTMPYDQANADRSSSQPEQQPHMENDNETCYLPTWFDRYVEYKFNLLDRAGDGVVDEEEFEFTLSDGFDISPNDCRIAFRIFTQNGEKKVDLAYFREMALQFYLSDDPSDLGNFINGKLQYE